MDIREFFQKTEPEMFEKLAGEESMENIYPLLEKTAQYAVYLTFKKMAEEGLIESQAPVEEVVASPAVAPVTGNKDNQGVVANPESGGLNIQQAHDAMAEAIQAGQPDKIIPFVKAVASSYPTLINEVIKAAKTELHDGIMHRVIEEQKAVEISKALNSLVEG
jgi:hypothetical protein